MEPNQGSISNEMGESRSKDMPEQIKQKEREYN